MDERVGEKSRRGSGTGSGEGQGGGRVGGSVGGWVGGRVEGWVGGGCWGGLGGGVGLGGCILVRGLHLVFPSRLRFVSLSDAELNVLLEPTSWEF